MTFNSRKLGGKNQERDDNFSMKLERSNLKKLFALLEVKQKKGWQLLECNFRQIFCFLSQKAVCPFQLYQTKSQSCYCFVKTTEKAKERQFFQSTISILTATFEREKKIFHFWKMSFRFSFFWNFLLSWNFFVSL